MRRTPSTKIREATSAEEAPEARPEPAKAPPAGDHGLPVIYTLKDVLDRYAGIFGRTFLLDRLNMFPEFNGGPTHRRLGNRIVFYAEDIPRMIAALERPRDVNSHRATGPAPPSAEKTYLRLLKRLTAPKPKGKRK